MANRPITELDFFRIKEQLRLFLRDQTKFKDYDFEGSNMAVLLDLLSYNTYKSNFYTHMALSEMFLDSAQLENSIVSHAKELNYLPRSAKSAKAIVNITIKNSNEVGAAITIPKNSRFTTTYQGRNFTFYTRKSYVATRTTGDLFAVGCVELFEGELVREAFVFSPDKYAYVLENEGVDTSSITVSTDDDTLEYVYKKDIFGVTATDPVYYIEPSFDSKYAITFGRNVFGRNPNTDSEVVVRYQISSGTLPNGSSRFSSTDFSNAIIEVVTPAQGGADKESITDIKFFAPKSIQIQERAVTSSDYEVLLKQRFPEIQAISVLGGDELMPPQYGKVAISVKLFDETTVPSNLSAQYVNYLADKTPLAIKPIFIQPKFNYIDLVINVDFTMKLSNKGQSELETLIRNAIRDFNNDNLNGFDKTLRVSRLSSIINDLDEAILSNSISARPIIEYSPIPNVPDTVSFSFDAEIVKPYPFRQEVGLSRYKPSIKSGAFVFENQEAFLLDDGNGSMMIASLDLSKNQLLKLNAGTVNYETGVVSLSDFAVQSYTGRAISIYAEQVKKDIQSPKNTVISIRDKDVAIQFTEIR